MPSQITALSSPTPAIFFVIAPPQLPSETIVHYDILIADPARMEADFGFPVTNVKTYEVVLREHFKFRKNLEAGQWLLVGRELERMKQQGRECIVYLSGQPVDPRLVSKNIRREHRDADRRRLKRNKCQELPSYISIAPMATDEFISTQTVPLVSTGDTEAYPSSALPPESLSSYGTTLNDTLLEQIISNPMIRVYQELCENVPSKELVRFLCNLWQCGTLSPDEMFRLAGVLHDLVYVISNYMLLWSKQRPHINDQTLPRPRMFGVNDSIAILETACITLVNGHDIDRCKGPIEQWIGEIADLTLLQRFFSLPKPAVAAIWDNIFRDSIYRWNNAMKILMEVALKIDRGAWLRGNSERNLYHALLRGDKHTVRLLMASWQTSIGHRTPPKLSRFRWPSADVPIPTCQGLLACMDLMLRESAHHNVLSQDLNNALGFLVSTVLMKTLVPVCGCVASAKTGVEALEHFLYSLDYYTPQEKCQIQQLALLGVVGQGDIRTTQIFLDFGVDPEVGLLPRVKWSAQIATDHRSQQNRDGEMICYLDPVSRAAAKGDLQMLDFLLHYGVYVRRHIIDALVAAWLAWSPPYRVVSPPILDNEEHAATVAYLLGADMGYGFSLNAVKSLVANGEKVHSEKDDEGNSLLVDALLAQSRDRYQVVHFLLQCGSDVCAMSGLNMSVLEATLWNTTLQSSDCLQVRLRMLHYTACPATGRTDDDKDREVTLDLVNDFLELGTPINSDSASLRTRTKPLLVLLVECDADLSVIKRIVAAGADINERSGTCTASPLAAAVETEQLEIAEWLIEQGADTNITWDTIYGYRTSILAMACRVLFSEPPFIRLLIEKGAGVDPPI
ncbi:uncharacterized protein PG998_004532 [Apiospora kogelbergensis]|uniref:uncharacterized protein n=1 Tax=Apiospora kogelbergensis TaxID=1337665 RepID=UPI00312EB96F